MIRFLEEVTLDKALFRPLKWKFIKLGMEGMWKSVMPKSSHMLHRFGGKPEAVKKLHEFLLDPTTGILRGNDCSWVHDALEKVMNPKHAKLQATKPALSYQNPKHAKVQTTKPTYQKTGGGNCALSSV